MTELLRLINRHDLVNELDKWDGDDGRWFRDQWTGPYNCNAKYKDLSDFSKVMFEIYKHELTNKLGSDENSDEEID